MFYVQNIEGCLDESGVQGVSLGQLEGYLEKLTPWFEKLRKSYEDKTLPLLRIGEWQDDLEEGLAVFQGLVKGADDLVVLGAGGSGLGGKALVQIAREEKLRIHFLHNLDARQFERLFKRVDLERTRILSISKSGNTPETLAQTILALDLYAKSSLPEAVRHYFLAITEPEKEGVHNGLRALCKRHDLRTLEHDPDLGGRYSVFSTVGLLPAVAAGLNPYALREGARSVVENLIFADDLRNCPPALGACINFGLLEKRGIQTSVLMPYAGELDGFTDWFAQLWAESLGKSGCGTVPVGAIGPADQHSMLQLFLDGPQTFLMNLVSVNRREVGARIDPELSQLAGAGFLAGRTCGDLVGAQQKAIRDSFIRMGRPVRSFEIDQVNEYAVGAMMMHFMMETILTAGLMGINPFDQPAVELGKQLTREYLEEDRKACGGAAAAHDDKHDDDGISLQAFHALM